MDDLTGARTRAGEATERVATLEQNAPEMLRNLKSNLTSIFSKDNPLIQQREQALSTFLAAPSATRASTLPTNLPQVAGSNLNLSPTQLASVEQGRTAAAFAPLASLNNLIVGQYGNIGDILSGAASTYEAQVNAARTRAAGALDLYRQLVGEDQFNRELAFKEAEAARKGSGGGGMDLSGLFAQLFGQQDQQPELDIQALLDALIEEEEPAPVSPTQIQTQFAPASQVVPQGTKLNLNLGLTPGRGLTPGLAF